MAGNGRKNVHLGGGYFCIQFHKMLMVKEIKKKKNYSKTSSSNGSK